MNVNTCNNHLKDGSCMNVNTCNNHLKDGSYTHTSVGNNHLKDGSYENAVNNVTEYRDYKDIPNYNITNEYIDRDNETQKRIIKNELNDAVYRVVNKVLEDLDKEEFNKQIGTDTDYASDSFESDC